MARASRGRTGWTAKRKQAAEDLLAEYTVDCHDEDERISGLSVAAEDTVELPTAASVIGMPVIVVGFGIEGDNASRLVASVIPDDMERCFAVSLADVEFAPGTDGARMVDCYRLWRGMEPIETSGATRASESRSRSSRSSPQVKATRSEKAKKPPKTRKTKRSTAPLAIQSSPRTRRKSPPKRKRSASVLDLAHAFDTASRDGDYFESFSVNSYTWTQRSEGTDLWIEECQDLLKHCVEASTRGQHADAREAFDLAFNLLRKIDTGDDSIIFFADEGGSWQVGVDWQVVLPAYFTSLAAEAAPEEYARSAIRVIDDFVKFERPKQLTNARRPASPEQKRAIKNLLRG